MESTPWGFSSTGHELSSALGEQGVPGAGGGPCGVCGALAGSGVSRFGNAADVGTVLGYLKSSLRAVPRSFHCGMEVMTNTCFGTGCDGPSASFEVAPDQGIAGGSSCTIGMHDLPGGP